MLSYNLLYYRTKIVNKIVIILNKANMHPNILFLLGVILNIYLLLVGIYNLYIEHVNIIRCIVFLLSLYNFDSSNLDFYTVLCLLKNLCLLYTVYISHVNPMFVYNYPRIHVILDNICKSTYYINILVLFYIFVFSSKAKGSSGSGASGDPSGSGGPLGSGVQGAIKNLR